MFLSWLVGMALNSKYLVFGLPAAKKEPLLTSEGGGVVFWDGPETVISTQVDDRMVLQ